MTTNAHNSMLCSANGSHESNHRLGWQALLLGMCQDAPKQGCCPAAQGHSRDL